MALLVAHVEVALRARGAACTPPGLRCMRAAATHAEQRSMMHPRRSIHDRPIEDGASPLTLVMIFGAPLRSFAAAASQPHAPRVGARYLSRHRPRVCCA
jgi:hypothetical protein